jgi:hypothetical protein
MSEPTFAEGYKAASEDCVRTIRYYFPSMPEDVKSVQSAVVYVKSMVNDLIYPEGGA